jgi:hypothetical protein
MAKPTKEMNEIKEGSEGYARFIIGNEKIQRGVTAWVTIKEVNGEYLEFTDNDMDRVYKVKKELFKFVNKV